MMLINSIIDMPGDLGLRAKHKNEFVNLGLVRIVEVCVLNNLLGPNIIIIRCCFKNTIQFWIFNWKIFLNTLTKTKCFIGQ